MFLSDNGPAIENGVLTDEDRKIRYVNQLRGHKGNIWENGVKSPFFIYHYTLIKDKFKYIFDVLYKIMSKRVNNHSKIL